MTVLAKKRKNHATKKNWKKILIIICQSKKVKFQPKKALQISKHSKWNQIWSHDVLSNFTNYNTWKAKANDDTFFLRARSFISGFFCSFCSLILNWKCPIFKINKRKTAWCASNKSISFLLLSFAALFARLYFRRKLHHSFN